MLDVVRISELLRKVPKPPEDSTPIGADTNAIHEFELRTGIYLPVDLREWLQIANGPCVGPGGMYGIRPACQHLNIESYLALFPSWTATKWIPVAGDGCGNYYIMPTQNEYGVGNPIVFIDTSIACDKPTFIVASDIEHFIISIIENELGDSGWPFDEDTVRRSDPNIIQFHGLALPWDSQ